MKKKIGKSGTYYGPFWSEEDRPSILPDSWRWGFSYAIAPDGRRFEVEERDGVVGLVPTENTPGRASITVLDHEWKPINEWMDAYAKMNPIGDF